MSIKTGIKHEAVYRINKLLVDLSLAAKDVIIHNTERNYIVEYKKKRCDNAMEISYSADKNKITVKVIKGCEIQRESCFNTWAGVENAVKKALEVL